MMFQRTLTVYKHYLSVVPKRTLHKRVPSIYSLFTKDNYSVTKTENPTEKPQNIIKKLGEKWNGLSKEDKDVYYKKYEVLKIQHEAEQLATAYQGYKNLLNEGVKFVKDMPANNMTDFESLWKTLTKSKRKHLLDAAIEKEQR